MSDFGVHIFLSVQIIQKLSKRVGGLEGDLAWTDRLLGSWTLVLVFFQIAHIFPVTVLNIV